MDLLNKPDLTSQERFKLLITDVPYELATSSPPLNPTVSEKYLVDKGGNEDWSHTTSTWRNRNSKQRLFTVIENGDIKENSITTKEINALKLNENRNYYILKTTYFHHGNIKYKGVRRTISEVKKVSVALNGENAVTLGSTNYCLIEYIFPSDKCISPVKHNGVPFIPSAPSLKRKIKEAVKTSAGPRSILSNLSPDLNDHIVPGTIPRNEAQISNFRNKLRKRNCKDDFQEIIDFYTNDDIGKVSINSLQFHPIGVRFVFALTPQLEEIVTYCCNVTGNNSILSIDTTFNVGNFFMTPTSYTLPYIINKRTNKPVNMPGPCLFHVEEENKEVYMYFAHSLIEKNQNFDRVRFIGGDRGRGQRGFMYPLRAAVLLPCTRHIQQNMKQKIEDDKVCEDIFKDIFGSRKDYMKGLIDCDTSSFTQTLQEVGTKWPKQFFDYFRKYIEDDMKEGMLSDVRAMAGLGEDFFYNNALECLNKKIKNKKREKQVLLGNGAPVTTQCRLLEALIIYKDLLFEERKFLQQAVIGRGPYKIAPDYGHLSVDERRFCVLSIEEKRQVLSTVDPFVKWSNALVTDTDVLSV